MPGASARSANLKFSNAGWTLNDASQAGDFILQAHEVAANVTQFTGMTRILQDSEELFRGIQKTVRGSIVDVSEGRCAHVADSGSAWLIRRLNGRFAITIFASSIMVCGLLKARPVPRCPAGG